jgi:cytochrome bd-type quinol oxidase subunit 1
MNYPVWDVPTLGSGWVIGIIAIFHTLISQFAVGGGLYLALAEHKALKDGRQEWLPLLRKHAKFFLVVTGVFGAVSGVGIWFAIGLANPESTSTLIHNFVFGWAMEWVFFIIELTAAAVYYYTWGKIPNKLHNQVGWLYAIASFFTLVIINGILTFMLTPGDAWIEVAGTGAEASRFWQAFFNPTYFPSLFLRILVCISLAGIWALLSYSQMNEQPQTKAEMITWSSKWLIPSFVFMPIFFAWYLISIPEVNRQLLQFGISTIGSGAFTQVTRISLVIVMTTATIVGVVYFFVRRAPEDFSFGHGVAVLLLALVANGSAEYARETLRKPYSIARHMYSNGIRQASVAQINQDGYLTKSHWTRRAEGDSQSPEVILAKGEAMFRGQCLSCHTETGYRAMKKYLTGRSNESIANLMKTLHDYKSDSPYRAYMPQLAGKSDEVAALSDYLDYRVNGKTSRIAELIKARESGENAKREKIVEAR